MRLALYIALLLFAPLSWATELRDVRLWDSPEGTRVVFDLSAATDYKVFSLNNPDRIVIDIVGVGREGIAKASKAAGKGIVQKLRAGPRENGMRVVLDVSTPVNPKSFSILPNNGYGYRVVVDLDNAVARAEAPALIPPPAPVAPSSPTVHVTEKPIIVAIDAGHGGEDPGASSQSGLQEKDVVLSIAHKLAKLVNSQPGMQAVLTRDGDYYIGLRDRVVKARKAQADLFVSIHCNAFSHSSMSGSAVYVVSNKGATNEHARWLANKENSADMVGGIEIQDKDNELAAVLIDLSQTATMEASFDLGNRMLDSLGQINNLQKPHVQQAGFVVLKAPDIPSVLIETAFLTNPKEELELGSPDYQEKMAHSMLDGIKGYFDSYRPQQQVVENEGDSSLNPLPRTQAVKLERKLKRPRKSVVSR
jgi:N-acetylmuramoyl-L-alanine amidase